VLAGRYQTEQLLGQGGMAAVWRGTDLRLDRPVAIKVLAGPGLTEPTALERFDREARTTARLTHPNVVAVYDVGTDDGDPYLVMELVEGRSVAAMLADGPLPWARVAALAAQACDGLGAAHAAGIVHRDVKPGNLLVTSTGVLKVCDFGIARLRHAGQNALTGTATMIGTAGYMAPEQITGEPVDARTDLYALGCTVYAMLTGNPPFVGEPLGVVHQHLNQPPAPLRSRRPDVPPALEALVAELLAKDPARRPADAGQVRARLAALAGGGPVAAPTRAAPTPLPAPTPPPARPVTGTRVMTPADPPTGPGVTRAAPGRFVGADAPPPVGRPRSRRVPLTAAFAVVLVLLGAGLLFALARHMVAQGTGTSAGPAPAATHHGATPTRRKPPKAEPTPKAEQTPKAEPSRLAVAGPLAVAAVKAAVQKQANAGELGKDASRELQKKLDDIGRDLAKQNTEDARKGVTEFRGALDDLHDDGKLTDDGHRALVEAVNLVYTRLG
jgi:serine/threonine-protein kinase